MDTGCRCACCACSRFAESAQIRRALMQIFRGKHHSRSSVPRSAKPASPSNALRWAWLFETCSGVARRTDAEGKLWARNLDPLAEALAQNYIRFLPKQTYPIRTGFIRTQRSACPLLWITRPQRAQETAGFDRGAHRSYLATTRITPSWEPVVKTSFTRFDRSRLNEARANSAEFERWVPPLSARRSPKASQGRILHSGRRQRSQRPKAVHLGWLESEPRVGMRSIAAALPKMIRRETFWPRPPLNMARCPGPCPSGNYEGEHWLASFAVFLLSRPRLNKAWPTIARNKEHDRHSTACIGQRCSGFCHRERAETTYLYKRRVVQAAPGRLLELIDLYKSQCRIQVRG